MVVAALTLAATSVALGLLARLALRRSGRRTSLITTAAAAALLLAFILGGRDRAWMADLLPGSGVAILAAWTLPLATLVVACAWGVMPPPWWRRGTLAALCLGAAAWDAYAPLLAPTPRTTNAWATGVCLQTTPSTCSPAAAATLLLQHGVVRTEGDLAEACLSTARGTGLLGLVGGLRRYAPPGMRVRVAEVPLEALDEIQLPAVVSVVLTPELHHRDTRFRDDWGWIVGQPHSVVLYAIDVHGRALVGDPANGREIWGDGGLASLWNRRAVWLERAGP